MAAKQAIKLTKANGITTAQVGDLYPYVDNPKDEISDDNLERLNKQLELGEHSNLLITEDGEVLGGNSRLKAYKADGRKTAKVTVASFEPKGKQFHIVIDGVKSKRLFASVAQAKAELAISHNDGVNPYNPEKLKNIMQVHDIPMSIYSVATTVKPIETAVADGMIQSSNSEDGSGDGGSDDNSNNAGGGGGGDSWRECPSCGYEGEAREFFPDN